MRSMKGQTTAAIGPVLSVLVMGIGLAIGIYVFATFAGTSTMTGLTGTANSTWQSVSSNTYSGLLLLSIAIIVIAAGSIIYYLLSSFKV